MNGAAWAAAAQEGLVWLDGGLATELERRGYDLRDPLWSATLLLSDPGAIMDVHTSYLEAGADVITTASYQASYAGLADRGLTHDQAGAVLRRSVVLARQARDRYAQAHPRQTRRTVAASVGPFGAAAADGSEYTGAYGDTTREQLRTFHDQRLHELAAAGPDLVACETIPNAMEVEVLAGLLDQVLREHDDGNMRAWVSLSCRNAEQLCDGTPVATAIQPLLAVPGIAAIGVNCTAPRHVAALVRRLVDATDGTPAIIVYPNAGEGWDAQAHAWRGSGLTPDAYATMARDWVSAGATIIGGCCRTTPEHIATLRSQLSTLRPD